MAERWRETLSVPVFSRSHHVIEDQPTTNFLHGDPLGLERIRTACLGRVRIVIETRQGAASQLLGAHGGHINKQKAAQDWFGLRTGLLRRVRIGGLLYDIDGFHG